MNAFRLSTLALAIASVAACQNMPTSNAGASQQMAQPGMAASTTAPASGLRTTTVDYLAGNAAGGDLPPAKVGECYARVLTPAVITETSDRVLKRAATTSIAIVPASFADAEERVLVRAASKRSVFVPAVYEEADERVLIKPASTQLVTVPATYKTATERRLVRAAYTVWKRSSELSAAERALQNIDPNAGDVLCLIEVPAEYTTVSSQVIDQAAGTREVAVPAEYTTVKRSVIKTPAALTEVDVPAEYAMVKTSKIVSPAREVRTDIPAEYETVSSRSITSPARSEWRQILCETNATPSKLSEIQSALNKAGYATGRTDGAIDAGTLAAVRGYQKAKNLPIDGDRYINVATVRSLGVSEK